MNIIILIEKKCSFSSGVSDDCFIYSFGLYCSKLYASCLFIFSSTFTLLQHCFWCKWCIGGVQFQFITQYFSHFLTLENGYKGNISCKEFSMKLYISCFVSNIHSCDWLVQSNSLLPKIWVSQSNLSLRLRDWTLVHSLSLICYLSWTL